jgi:hypothetical protein
MKVKAGRAEAVVAHTKQKAVPEGKFHRKCLRDAMTIFGILDPQEEREEDGGEKQRAASTQKQSNPGVEEEQGDHRQRDGDQKCKAAREGMKVILVHKGKPFLGSFSKLYPIFLLLSRASSLLKTQGRGIRRKK